jgi:hypothetical protein
MLCEELRGAASEGICGGEPPREGGGVLLIITSYLYVIS